MRISQTEAHNGLWKQGEVNVAHASCRIEVVWRGQYRNRRSRSWRIEGICQQVIIREILIATETALQVVPPVLISPQAHVVVRIASPSHAVEVKIVEQQALVIDRLHRECLVEDSRSGLQIHQCVVHIAATSYVAGAVAQFD